MYCERACDTSIIRDEAAKLLESKDLDTEGRMSYEEFMGEQTKAERLFKLMDKDGDGYVTKNVSVFFVKDCCKCLRSYKTRTRLVLIFPYQKKGNSHVAE